jgi:hypothetical protein
MVCRFDSVVGRVTGGGRVFIAGEGSNTNDTFLRTGTEADEEAFTRGRRQNPTMLATMILRTRQKGAKTKIQRKEEHKKEGPCLRTIDVHMAFVVGRREEEWQRKCSWRQG